MELQEQLGHFAFHFPEHSWAKAHPAPRGNKDMSPAEAIPRSYQHQSPSRHPGSGPLVAPQGCKTRHFHCHRPSPFLRNTFS